jgi:anion-transporting  ArsA/GET3 family ATPase
VSRAKEVSRVLSDRRTTFIVVSTLEAAPAHEAEFFIDALQRRRLHLGALVLNKVLPGALLDPRASDAAVRLRADAGALASRVAGLVDADPAQVARVLDEVAESFHNFQVVAKREAEERAELASAPEVTVAVPYLDEDVHDLSGLARLGARLWR